MIGIPCSPRPSKLLWTKDLTVLAKALQDECEDAVIRARSGQQHRDLDALHERAKGLQAQGDNTGYAVILLYLADIALTYGRLGPALRFSTRAEKTFANPGALGQSHNHAVALYSLGLLYQLLGLEEDALKHYSNSIQEFKAAEQQWSTQSSSDPSITQCRRVCAEIPPRVRGLIDYVNNVDRSGGTTAIRCPMLVGCWPSGPSAASVDQMTIDIKILGISVEMSIHGAAQSYQLESLGGGTSVEPAIEPGKEYLVVDIPPELAQTTWFQGAKYALIRKEIHEDQWAIGTEQHKSDQVLWGRFARDPNGKIQFVTVYDKQFLSWPRFIGEADLDLDSSGTIIGIFR